MEAIYVCINSCNPCNTFLRWFLPHFMNDKAESQITKICEGYDILLYLKANKLAIHCVTDGCQHNTLGSETQQVIWASCLFWFPYLLVHTEVPQSSMLDTQ